MSNFFEDYKRPEWQKFRLAVFEHHGFTCQYCNEEKKQLHAHHYHYRKGAKPWEYDIREVHCLCESCHKKQHTKDINTGETPIENLIFTMSRRDISPQEAKNCFILGYFLTDIVGYGAAAILEVLSNKKLVRTVQKFIEKITTYYLTTIKNKN